MNNNYPPIKIENQLYDIQIDKNETMPMLVMLMRSTITHNYYECHLNSNEIKRVTKNSGYIRNMDQFYSFLSRAASREPKFNLTGQIDQQNDLLILSLEVKLDPVDDNETTIYVIEFDKLDADPIYRMEDMLLNFNKRLANFPINREKIKNLVSERLTEIKIELFLLIKKNIKKLTKLINENGNHLACATYIIIDYMEKINNTKVELTQLINTNILNAKIELAEMIDKIQQVLDRNNLK